MANITLEDGSQLNLNEEELVLFLKVTGKYVEPKTQAEIITEKMIELRNKESQENQVQEFVEEIDETPGIAQQMADEMADEEVPEEPVAKTPRARRLRIPFTAQELELMNEIKRAGRPMTTRELSELVGRPASSVSANLSHVFQTQRGLQRGPKVTWFIENWALRSVWEKKFQPKVEWDKQKKGNNAQ